MKRPHYDLIIAWANGAEIEKYDQFLEQWFRAKRPTWGKHERYRIAEVDDVIPWEDVSEDFQWFARDKDGNSCFFINEPFAANGEFSDVYLSDIDANFFANYKPGTTDWKTSKRKRQEGK